MSLPPLNLNRLRDSLEGRGGDTLLLILGSGMSGAFAPSEYEVIGALPSLTGTEQVDRETVEGHLGIVALWNCSGVPVLLSLGRRHLYEGASPDQLVSLVRWSGSLGVKKLILTNAAGGLHPGFSAGDVMLHRGYLPTLLGRHRLRGAEQQLPQNIYHAQHSSEENRRLLDRFVQRAASQRIQLQEGVYAGVTGPNYETAAEIRMLRRMGADAVGMSTIVEVEEGMSWGMKRLGLSLITNVLSDTRRRSVTHDEVTDVATISRDHLRKLLEIGVKLLTEEG